MFRVKVDGLKKLEQLSKKELIELVKDLSKRWLAHDGIWFQCIEKNYGLDEAVKIDGESWDRFSKIEAARIMRFLEITPNSGLPALMKALELRPYYFLNKQEIVELSENKMIFRMNTCRVQSTRRRKGMPEFPCKSVGILEYSGFAKTIDSRIKTRCLSCPPDNHPNEYVCMWEFTI
ncbi:MAG: hypothetical protein XD78_2316 [Desulfotomaculum sp. 46_296]|nr:MAG: hypothetical protein XD78_2316 [Desulfotomaculum sp. 46_296]